jgi:HEAT repeat protein
VLLVSSAAVSLGVPGNEKAVAPLGKLLGSSSERVRMAAIRGLGRIGTPSAQARLAQAAASHPDPDTRRRAGAEVAHRP